MTLSHSRAASNPAQFAQLNGSLVLLDLLEGHDVDPGAVQGMGYVLSSCKRVLYFLQLGFGVWRVKHLVVKQDGNNRHERERIRSSLLVN